MSEQSLPPVDRRFAKRLGLTEAEWELIIERMGRVPNAFECSIISCLWSERVCSKSSAMLLAGLFRDESRTIRYPGTRVGIKSIEGETAVVMRMVSSNLQAAVEPMLGSQMSIGRAMEEIAVVGAQPLALLPLMRFGHPDNTDNHRLFRGVVEGFGSFTNSVGVPMLCDELQFHRRYDNGVIANCCAVGVVDAKDVPRIPEAEIGSLLLYAGAETGRDGLHEKEASANGEESLRTGKPRLTVSDPLLAGNLSLACVEAVRLGVLRDAVVVGAGGLAAASFQLASKINKTFRFDLDRVPTLDDTMGAKDILFSETAERLLVVASKEKYKQLIEVFDKWGVTVSVAGEVIDEDGLRFTWIRKQIADIAFFFARDTSIKKKFQVVKYPPMLKKKVEQDENKPVFRDKESKKKAKLDHDMARLRQDLEAVKSQKRGTLGQPMNLEDAWVDLLADPNLCSRQMLLNQFDNYMQNRTVIGGVSDAAVLRFERNGAGAAGKERGLAVTVVSHSLFASEEPYLGAVQTVASARRNLAATGARAIAVAVCLNYGDPNRYRELCDLAESVRGLGDACEVWNIPIISDSVSLFNGSEGNPVLPTPGLVMAGIMEDVSTALPLQFRNKGDRILVLGETRNEINCSEYAYYCHQTVNSEVPEIDFDIETKVCELLCTLVERKLLHSAKTISGGGVAMSLADACLSRTQPLGATLTLAKTMSEDDHRADAMLFSESSGRFLVSCSPENEQEVRQICKEAEVPITGEGEVGGFIFLIQGAAKCEVPLATAYKVWSRGLHHLLGLETTAG